MIENIIKKIIGRVVRSSAGWNLFRKVLIPLCHYAREVRTEYDTPIPPRVRALLDEKVVRSGPFRGMKYPRLRASGSTLYAKILGSYESELHEVIEEMCRGSYDKIVDIGCAEGYYAVGLAMRVEGATVHAYDLDPRARDNCREMAESNGVESRVEIGEFCDADKLGRLVEGTKSLIICDCEGYERELFPKDGRKFWKDQYLLIELHDFLDPEISVNLRSLFEETHEIQTIASSDDLKKAHESELEDLKGESLSVKKLLLAEGRPGVMEWFWMKPRGQRDG